MCCLVFVPFLLKMGGDKKKILNSKHQSSLLKKQTHKSRKLETEFRFVSPIQYGCDFYISNWGKRKEGVHTSYLTFSFGLGERENLDWVQSLTFGFF